MVEKNLGMEVVEERARQLGITGMRSTGPQTPDGRFRLYFRLVTKN